MLSLQISKPSLLAGRTGKGEEDNDDYPADFSVTQGCHCAVSLVYYQCAAKFE